MDWVMLNHVALFILSGAATVYFIYVLTEALNTRDEPRGPMIRVRIRAAIFGVIALACWCGFLFHYMISE
jgi:hypothetical protein